MTPTTRPATCSPSTCSGMIPFGPASRATAVVASTGIGRPSVGCARAEASLPVGREDVAGSRSAAAHAAGADPVRERAGDRFAVHGRYAQRQDALRAGLDAGAGVRRGASAVQQVELELGERRVQERDPCVQDDGVPLVRLAERDRLVVAERRAEDGAQPDVLAVRRHGQLEPAAGGQRGRAQRLVARGGDAAGELRERSRREVAAPAAHVGEARWRQAEHRERRAAGNVPGQPEHRRRRRRIRRRRGGVQHGHELRQVLGQHEGRRHGVRGLVVLAVDQGRAVDHGEQRQSDARDQERRRDRRMPGIPSQRRGGEPDRDRPAAPDPSERAQRRCEQARGDHGRCEDDQRRHEQQERARAAARGQRLGIDRAARPADDHDRDRTERSCVERREREPPELHGRSPNGRVEQQAGDHGDAERRRAARRARAGCASPPATPVSRRATRRSPRRRLRPPSRRPCRAPRAGPTPPA